jgi:hypothetical protein
MSPAGFKPAIPAIDRPQFLSLDHPSTGIGNFDPRTVQPVESRHTVYAVSQVKSTKNQNLSRTLARGQRGLSIVRLFCTQHAQNRDMSACHNENSKSSGSSHKSK